MKKFIISEEEKSRILSLHEGYKNLLLNEQNTGTDSNLQIKYIGDSPNLFPSNNTSRHINVQKSDGTYQVFKLEGEKDVNKLDKAVQLIYILDGGKQVPMSSDKGSDTGQSWVIKLKNKPGNYKMVIEYAPNIPDSFEKTKIETNVSTLPKSNTAVTEKQPTGDTQNNVLRSKTNKSQASIDWCKGEVKGPINGKIYSASVSDRTTVGNKATEIQIKIPKIIKSSARDGSWLGYHMYIADGKTNEQLEGINIDCNSVNRFLNSSTWVDISAYSKSELKWYFNKEFLQDLKQTLGCK